MEEEKVEAQPSESEVEDEDDEDDEEEDDDDSSEWGSDAEDMTDEEFERLYQAKRRKLLREQLEQKRQNEQLRQALEAFEVPAPFQQSTDLGSEQRRRSVSGWSAAEEDEEQKYEELEDDDDDGGGKEKWHERDGLRFALRLFLVSVVHTLLMPITYPVYCWEPVKNSVDFERSKDYDKTERFFSPVRRLLRTRDHEGITPPPIVMLASVLSVLLSVILLIVTEDEFMFGARSSVDVQEDFQNYPVHIAFRDVGCEVASMQRPILHHVSGEIQPGKITALLGPSGAGKSTLAESLLGRGHFKCSKQFGRIYLNGRQRSLNAILDRVGFVPQEDEMYADLTVEETLIFSAGWRLPKGTSPLAREKALNDSLSALNLQDVRSQRIGGLKRRGISGGERKRVSIAMELMGRPSVLVMDEPTSGLDSAASFKLMQMLKDIADKGVSVVVALHVPSPRIYAMFDDVILLQDGEAIYAGPREKALETIRKMGFDVNGTLQRQANITEAEFLVDVLAGAIPYPAHICPYGAYATNPNTDLCQGLPTLPEWWRAHGGKLLWEEVEKRMEALREHEDMSYEEIFLVQERQKLCRASNQTGNTSTSIAPECKDPVVKRLERDTMENCDLVGNPGEAANRWCLILHGLATAYPYPRLPKPGAIDQIWLWFNVIVTLHFRTGFLWHAFVFAVLSVCVGWSRSYNRNWEGIVQTSVFTSISVGGFGMFSAVFTDEIWPVKRASEAGMILGTHQTALVLFNIIKGYLLCHEFLLGMYLTLWVRTGIWMATLNGWFSQVLIMFFYFQLNFILGSLNCVLTGHNFQFACTLSLTEYLLSHVFAQFTPNHRQIDLDSRLLDGKLTYRGLVKFLVAISPTRYFVEAIFLLDAKYVHDPNCTSDSGRRFTMGYFGYQENHLSSCLSILFTEWLTVLMARMLIFGAMNSSDFHSLYDTPLFGIYLAKLGLSGTLVRFVLLYAREKKLI